MSREITFVLMTCGEETEKDCLRSIASFRNHIEFFEVRNVFPQIVALNQMIAGVRTPYFVPLDADLVLEPNAWGRITTALNKHASDPKWHTILFPLWDTLTERRILALKLMRTQIMKANIFADTATPDVEHYQRLQAKGHTCVHDYLNDPPIARHIVRGKHFCYHKYRDVYQTYRSHNFEWDGGVFVGGSDLRSRAKAHFDYFFYRWVETGNDDYLSCILGMVDGLTSPVENKSKSLKFLGYVVTPENFLSRFVNWYTQQPVKPSSAMMLF